MTTENLQNVESTTLPADANKTSEVALTIEQALEKIKSLESGFQEAIAERDKSKTKLRKLEETAGTSTELQKKFDELFTEKSKLVEQFEITTNELTSVKENIKQSTINSVLTTALEGAGAKSISTVMKLIDKSKILLDDTGQVNVDSIVAAVEDVRNSDPILFGNPIDPKADPASTSTPTGQAFLDPGVKRAGENTTEDAFAKEMKSAKSQREIENILRKYGKM